MHRLTSWDRKWDTNTEENQSFQMEHDERREMSLSLSCTVTLASLFCQQTKVMQQWWWKSWNTQKSVIGDCSYCKLKQDKILKIEANTDAEQEWACHWTNTYNWLSITVSYQIHKDSIPLSQLLELSMSFIEQNPCRYSH